jgi:hypothetical protein
VIGIRWTWSASLAATILLLSLGAVVTRAQEQVPYPLVVHLVADTSHGGLITLSFFGAGRPAGDLL